MRLILFLIPVLAFAQLDDNTVTVAASRPIAVQPDQAVIGITVQTGTDATLDDVVATLKDAGVTAANLTDVFTAPVYVNASTQWMFSLAVPLVSLNSTLAALAGRRNVSYNLQGTEITPVLKAANPCPYPALLSDAQKQAQELARASGGTVGALVAISDQPPGSAVPTAVSRTGDFSFVAIYDPLTGYVPPAGSSLTSFLLGLRALYTPASPPPNCSLTAQFKLLR